MSQPGSSTRDRVSIVYQDPESKQDRELPLKILVIANFSGQPDPRPLDERKPIRVDPHNLTAVMAEHGIRLRFECPNHLTGDRQDTLRVDLQIRSFAEFEPAWIAEQVPELRELLERRRALSRLEPSDDHERHDRASADVEIVAIDCALAKQIDAILHHPDFQALESAWRALGYLLGQVDHHENIEIHALNCPKQELVDDFEDAPEIAKSGLYRLIYATEYGTFGGQPFGLIVCDYEFDPGPVDSILLTNCAAVAAMAHVPFLANAAPRFFGEDDFDALASYTDVRASFETPQFARWHGFRDSEDARYVGLCLPRFLLRAPHDGRAVEAFSYVEQTPRKSDYLWGHAAFAFATRVAESFARYRWSPNIVGPTAGGSVDGLPRLAFAAMRRVHDLDRDRADPQQDGAIEHRMPLEIQLTERQEFELSECGFIGLAFLKASERACFFSANSCQRPKTFANTQDGRAQSLGARLGAQLPYVFIVCRIAHYLKVLQREQIGRQLERGDLERELNEWLRQYVSDMDNPAASIRGKRPLRQAQVSVAEVPGQAGWYRAHLQLQPHLKYMGASFTLSLVGKLERE